MPLSGNYAIIYMDLFLSDTKYKADRSRFKRGCIYVMKQIYC